MKKYFLTSVALLFFIFSSFVSPTEELSGIILKKAWTKTTQSYCAGGSDYYVLSLPNEELVLENVSKIPSQKLFGQWVGKKVKVVGTKYQKKIKNDNDSSQRPVEDDPITGERKDEFSCWVFKVQKIYK
ncbi:MAG: hypothetical protein EAZ08_04510 [Cytophagales bacterium]|nr:MAG: hypothetical protein EAZ08_04510 [Cytophagales bacterium]